MTKVVHTRAEHARQHVAGNMLHRVWTGSSTCSHVAGSWNNTQAATRAEHVAPCVAKLQHVATDLENLNLNFRRFAIYTISLRENKQFYREFIALYYFHAYGMLRKGNIKINI